LLWTLLVVLRAAMGIARAVHTLRLDGEVIYLTSRNEEIR
jgi:hypothetical protein